MSSLGQRLIAAAKEGRAIVRAEADPSTYRVHVLAQPQIEGKDTATPRASG